MGVFATSLKLKMKNTRSLIFASLLLLFCSIATHAQESKNQYIEKRYNIFFRINSPVVDYTFKDNARTIDQMKLDIETTLQLDGVVPDSLLILSTASPDGSYWFNKQLAKNRAASTEKLLLEMFPQFKDAHIKVEFLEEDWDGLKQVLLAHPEFPQREEMLAIINDDNDVQSKEYRLRELKSGWRYLVNNYIHALRNSSITLSVVMTATNADDEFVREKPVEPIPALTYEYTPTFKQPMAGDIVPCTPEPPTFFKTILAARSNMLMPGMSIGIEIPIHENWSIGIDYNYPWGVSKNNKWCGEQLSWFVDGKYWFTNDKTRWTPTSKLKGHGVGLYGGFGYYDYQTKAKGAQGEFIDFGVDYVFGLPVANDKLRIEFNIGLGFIKTWYRPYNPASDFSDLIKEPGVKYRSTNFIGPTKAGISLVYPITVPVKQNPYTPIIERQQRKAERQSKRKGGDK